MAMRGPVVRQLLSAAAAFWAVWPFAWAVRAPLVPPTVLRKDECARYAAAVTSQTAFTVPFQPRAESQAATKLFRAVNGNSQLFFATLLAHCAEHLSLRQRANFSILSASLNANFADQFRIKRKAHFAEALAQANFFVQAAHVLQYIRQKANAAGAPSYTLQDMQRAVNEYQFPQNFPEESRRKVKTFIGEISGDIIYTRPNANLLARLDEFAAVLSKIGQYIFAQYATFSRALDAVKSLARTATNNNGNNVENNNGNNNNDSTPFTLEDIDRRYSSFIARPVENLLDELAGLVPNLLAKGNAERLDFFPAHSPPVGVPAGFTRERCAEYLHKDKLLKWTTNILQPTKFRESSRRRSVVRRPSNFTIESGDNAAAVATGEYYTVLLQYCPNMDADTRARISLMRIVQNGLPTHGPEPTPDAQLKVCMADLNLLAFCFSTIVGALKELSKTVPDDTIVPDGLLVNFFKKEVENNKDKISEDVLRAGDALLSQLEKDAFTFDKYQLVELLEAYAHIFHALISVGYVELGRLTISGVRGYASKALNSPFEQLQNKYKELADTLNMANALSLLQLMQEKGAIGAQMVQEKGAIGATKDALLSVNVIAMLNEGRKSATNLLTQNIVVSTVSNTLSGFYGIYSRLINSASRQISGGSQRRRSHRSGSSTRRSTSKTRKSP